MKFPSRPMSNSMRLMTALVGLSVATGMPIWAWQSGTWWSWAIATAVLLVFLWPLRDSPTSFLIEGRTVSVVGRLGRSATFEVLDVLAGPPSLGIRWFGTSGFMGHSGWFGLRGGGTARVFATTADDLVLLRTPRGAVVVSPDDREVFVRTLRSAIAETASASTASTPATPSARQSRT